MLKKHDKTNISSTFSLDLDDAIKLSPEQKAELDSLYDGLENKFQVGKIIIGKIIAVDGNNVLVDIDYKSNGLIPGHEFTDVELKRFREDNTIDVVIDRLEDEDGNVVLSYQKAKSLKAWEKIADIAKTDDPVRGIVLHKVKGGLSVDIGIPAFLPGSQVDTQRVTDFDQFVGKEVICKILKINKKRGNVIISRRKYLEEQRSEERKIALETIQEGQVVQGIVKNITNYGVFVDIGGIDGLLHITDMSWGRIAHPSELVRIGDTISVKILSFDKEREKISLGMKQLTENPWDTIEDKYTVDSKVSGRVSSITDYGLFVEVEKGIEGLVHISEISWTDRITNLSKHFKTGDKVEAIIVALDKENRRMSLSVKQIKGDPWRDIEKKFKVDEKISGRISNITDFGIFVQLDEGIDGLVHVSDLSWTDHISHPGERFKKGDVVEAIILGIDAENRKISLGIKQIQGNPWEEIEKEYPVGKIVEGTVSKITNFGAFIKLPSGIEGLVHVSELANKGVKKVEDVLTVGQKTQFKVIKVNKEEQKLGLSLKALEDKVQTEAPKKAKSSANKPKSMPKSGLNNTLKQALDDMKEKLAEEQKDDDKKE
ncbi:30S ribosomal protein S1 [Candidatus Babeliales bacterium]|nr:30S ribosomal protein S1 [Candidatus Babeliales bacterium]